MKKIAILTCFTNYIRWDDYGKCDYGNLSSINHNEYSYRHNYTYIKEIIQNEDFPDWHPTWIKIHVIKKYLPLFDYVVWIDADAVFVNQQISIESLIESHNVDLIIPKQEFDQAAGQMWTNTTTGFMVWKNSEWSERVLNELWDNPQDFKTEFFHEQSRLDEILQPLFENKKGHYILDTLIEFLNAPLVFNNVKVLPVSYHRYFEDGEIKYVYHAGGNTGTKLERLKSILQK
jgi:hypothetical protein